MYGNQITLPLINNPNPNQNLQTEPKSLSYFRFARDSMKNGDLNPSYSLLVSQPYHPYHNPSQMDINYNNQSLETLGQHPYLNSYPLPKIKNNDHTTNIKSGELVDFPDETYIPLKKFNQYKDKVNLEINLMNERERAKSAERKRIEVYGVGGNIKPGGLISVTKLHRKNLHHWKFFKDSTNIILSYLSIKKLNDGHKNLRSKKFVLVQAAKEGMARIRDFLLPILSNIEDFCLEFFKNTIIFNINDEERFNKSVFVTKSFIHQLFSDLTAALAKNDDFPKDIKEIINSFIKNGILLPYGFLSTFEFNRLEFTTDGLLNNMNLDRQALLVCFIVLYRILLVDIFKRYLFYFKKIREADIDEITLVEAYEKKLQEIEDRKNIQQKRKGLKMLKRKNDTKDVIKEENEDDEEENKIFEEDENQENYHREMENKETLGMSDSTPPPCPPKKKKKVEESESEEESKSKNNKKSESHFSSSKGSKISSNKKSSSSQNKSSSNKKSSKNENSENNENENENENNESENENENKSENKNEKNKKSGKKYGYSGYYDKNKDKKRPKKGIYFDDDRQEEVQNEIKREQERVKEEKLRNKLEDSNASSSDSGDDSSDSGSKSKNSKSKNSKKKNSKKSESSTSNSKTSEVSSSTSNKKSISKISKKKNINQEFWGTDLDDKENEKKSEKENSVVSSSIKEIDPYEERKNRVKKLPKDVKIKILDEERQKLKMKIKHNFHVITNILHYIFKGAIQDNVPIYNEFFKEKYLYSGLVFKKNNKQYANGNDDIELSRGIIIDEESTNVFIEKNERWAQMYKILTFQFCRDFAQKCQNDY